MKKIVFLIAVIFSAFVSVNDSAAQVKLSPLFTDNMVLQQKSSAPVWGSAAPGSRIAVKTSWNKKSYETQADKAGEWMVKVDTPKAGGPYVIIISENGWERVKLSNVLIGEVWLCAGQSNMEMPVGGVWGKVLNYQQELKDASKYSEIRLMSVNRVVNPRPQKDFTAVGDGWQVCSAESLDEFSATAYFFGKTIHEERGVPVGLINASWGGTIIEAWMSHGALAGVKGLEDQADIVAQWPESQAERKQIYVDTLNDWLKKAADFDNDCKSSDEFSAVSYNDEAWDNLCLPGDIERVYGEVDGHFLVRKSVQIPKSWEGQPVKLCMAAIDDNDVTYFNGVKIGETFGWDIPRKYEIPAEAVKAGQALVAIRIMDTRGTGGVAGGDDTFYLEGPDGQKVTLSGVWKSSFAIDYNGLIPKPMNMYDDPNLTTVLYNSMISPLVPYEIKGAIWYQGCSNEYRAYQYRDLMRLMIQDWRSQWNYEFPFYITQLANFRAPQTVPCESAWAELREAQSMAAEAVSNAGIAVTVDIGEAYDIHPKNKPEVGRRLALQALNKTYGEKVMCSGPVYSGYEISGNVIRLKFDSVADGLECLGPKLEGFAIAGADRVFYWADAKIVGNVVEVSCPEVKMPLAVRYAWADNPLGNLYNTEKLPASPFRTDDWPGVTFKK